MTNFFKEVGAQLIDNGYQIIPIVAHDADHLSAGKAPALYGWREYQADHTDIPKWARKYPRNGIGINTTYNPAVDIDVKNEEGARYMRAWVEDNIGLAPVRVGRAPKTLLLFKTDTPFTKVKSSVWVEDDGTPKGIQHAVEILADGEQFVAYGIHPDTKRPYSWVSMEQPVDSHSDFDLNLLTLTDARVICDEFDRWASKNTNWVKTTRPMRGREAGTEDDWEDEDDGEGMDDHDLADVARLVWEGTEEELEELLDEMPNDGGYDDWIRIIAAVKSAEPEPDVYKELARTWSAKSELHDDIYFEGKWDGGQFRRQIGEVANLNVIAKTWKKDRERKETTERVKTDIIPAFQSARTMEEWMEAAAQLRLAEIFGLTREMAEKAAVTAFNAISDVKMSAKEIGKHLKFDWSQTEAPAWLEPWVYLGARDVMYNRQTGAERTSKAFDNEFAPMAAEAGATPMVFARKLRPVPAVENISYRPIMHGEMPGNRRGEYLENDDPAFFLDRGRWYLNAFDPATIPVMPEKMSKKELQAAAIVEQYFNVQIPDPAERDHFLDWMSYVMQNPGHRIHYAAVVIGGEGSGKTILKVMVEHLLGKANVETVSNEVIHKSFNYWAEGAIVKVIEELSAADGGGGYDLVNKLKEPIANDTLHIERKGRDALQVNNTASWLAYTNDVAAIPVDSGSRRFLVVTSRFRHQDDVLAYSAEHPTFFSDFEKAFTEHPGAVRKWFADRKRSPAFNPTGHAPVTNSKNDMVLATQSSFTQTLLDAIQTESIPGITAELICTSHIQELGTDLTPRRLARTMSQLGYYPLQPGKQTKVMVNGVRGTVYAKDPKAWLDGEKQPHNRKIWAHFKQQMKKLEEQGNSWEDVDDL
ncbi:hypothetical protein 13AC503A_gene0006 [Aeromonas phage 13AC503A]|nr:hypothetical protein 13AC503A_gene0006 [Aeromonas phage 13AC503A]